MISCVPLIVEKIIKKDILPKVDSTIGKLLLKVPIVNDKIKSLARQAAMEIFGGNFDEIIIEALLSMLKLRPSLKRYDSPIQSLTVRLNVVLSFAPVVGKR